jgi:hypothetical protein
MSFITRKFGKIDFCKKKFGLNDPRIGCKLPPSFVDFIETDANLKEELDEFERAFEKNEVMKL